MEGSGEWARAGRGSAGEQGPGAGRGGSVRARAKRALWARPERARKLFGQMPKRAIGLG